jgi:class 3 adenylate cyclase
MADVTGNITNILMSFGPTGVVLALTAIPVAIGIAVYITRMGQQAKIDRLEGELKRSEERKADEINRLTFKIEDVTDKYEKLLQRGIAVQTKIDNIKAEIDETSDHINATDCSILVPAPTVIQDDITEEFIFLYASGPQGPKLQWVRVPIATSLSGQVYQSGRSTIASPPTSGASFASRTDKAIDYKTEETLSVCLKYKNKKIGVAQFLNKKNGQFTASDVEIAEDQCKILASKIFEFISDPKNITQMGHTPRRNQIRITAMFVDISNSEILFKMLDSSVITNMFNQFFQEICSIGFKFGAVVDQFLGDGALLLFNVDQNQSNHENAAFSAAMEMKVAFNTLRDRWINLGYASKSLYVRFGISCGSVTRAELGYSQARRLTVIGPSVNEAAHACDAAPRDRDTICVTRAYWGAITAPPGSKTSPLTSKRSGEVLEVL